MLNSSCESQGGREGQDGQEGQGEQESELREAALMKKRVMCHVLCSSSSSSGSSCDSYNAIG